MVKWLDFMDVNIYYGLFYVVVDVLLVILFCSVMVFIGFLGCGKMMVLCILNWMYEVIFGV